MNWSTVGVSLLCSVVVALLTTVFNSFFGYRIWRVQKRHEQQLAVAEGFANLADNAAIWGQRDWTDETQFTPEQQAICASAALKQTTLLALGATVFQDKTTIDCMRALADEISKSQPSNADKIHSLRVHLLAVMFAEALSLPQPTIRTALHDPACGDK